MATNETGERDYAPGDYPELGTVCEYKDGNQYTLMWIDERMAKRGYYAKCCACKRMLWARAQWTRHVDGMAAEHLFFCNDCAKTETPATVATRDVDNATVLRVLHMLADCFTATPGQPQRFSKHLLALKIKGLER